jgi:hypothetical protein
MIGVEEVNSVLALREPFRKPNNKLDDAMLLELSRLLREKVSPSAKVHSSFLYYSRLRPTSAGLKLPNAIILNDRWWYAEKPLRPRTIINFELQPVYLSLGRFLYDASVESNTPVELTHKSMPEDGFRAVTLFLNPKKKWQLSTFEDGVGPIGHVDSAYPEELLTDAIYSGKYRHWNPGVIDMISDNFRKNPWQNPTTSLDVAKVNRVLAKPDVARKRDGRLDLDLHFAISIAYADMYGDAAEYGYVSSRPVTIAGLSVVTQIGPHWFYGATRPLRPERIVESDLQPFDRALAAFLLGSSQIMGKPIELVKSEKIKRGDWVYALFRNPMGNWQLSRFEVGEGPIGHTEGKDAQELLKDPLRQGYRVWLEGAVDRVLESPRSNPAARQQATGTLLRELRSPSQGQAASQGSERVGKAFLVRLDPPLRGVEYAMASHLVVDGTRHEVAFFPSDKNGRWPTRMLEVATVFDVKGVPAALAKLGYEPRSAIG